MENRIIFKNTPPQTLELVNKLANDDAFRLQFEHDPKTALAYYDIVLPENVEFTESKLPSKEEMQRMQQEFINKQPQSSVILAPNAHYFALFAFFAFKPI